MKPCDITTLFNFYISKRIKVNSASVSQRSFPFPSRAKERWTLLIRRVEWLRNYMLYIKILFAFKKYYCQLWTSNEPFAMR